MKIAELKTFVVGNPPPAFGGRYFLFLKLKTACGIEGVGEVYAASFAPKAIVTMIEDVFERHVEGADPFRIEALWRNVYGRGYSGRPDISLMGVLSGVEMALWDIVGKAVGKPIYALLGGKVHERLRSYTYLYPDEPGSHAYSDSPVYSNPHAAAERALKYMAQGFTAVKFDPAGPYTTFDPRQPSLERLELCEAFCKALREAVGARCDLLFGTHGQFTVSGALRLARRIEPYEPLWFEEPTPPEAPEEMAKVAAQCRMPIATGERLATKYEFARVLETGAASILQMNLGRVGGILEAKKIAAWPKRTTHRSRRTSIAGRSLARPMFSLRLAARTFSSWRASSAGTASTPRSSKSRSAGKTASSFRRKSQASGSSSTRRSRSPIRGRARISI